MRKLTYAFVFLILLFGFFSSINIQTKANTVSLITLAQDTINLSDYSLLLDAYNASTGQPLVSAQVLRYNKNGLHRYKPILITRNEFGHPLAQYITNATWKQLSNGKIRTTFYVGSNVELIVQGNTFEQHTSATLLVNGQATDFGSVYQSTSDYYWTTQSQIVNRAFACPAKKDPPDCPGILFN